MHYSWHQTTVTAAAKPDYEYQIKLSCLLADCN